MPQHMKLWEVVESRSLKEIEACKLDFEERLEEWLENDISILSSDLLVIGRQVETDFGGSIDLLCIDYNGDLVIVELKRDRTPRDITAQVLDYASWVTDLSNDAVTEIADWYLKDQGQFEVVFKTKFDREVPETVNEHHKMVIVASVIDGATERIVRYLSHEHAVPINVATFKYFRQEDKEFVARVFLIEPETVEQRTQTKGTSKRKPPLTREQLQQIADNNGVGDLYRKLVAGVEAYFDESGTTRGNIAFIWRMGEKKSRNTVLSIFPGNSSREKGLYGLAFVGRISEHLGIEKEKAVAIFPSYARTEDWGSAGECGKFWLREDSEIEHVLSHLGAARRSGSA